MKPQLLSLSSSMKVIIGSIGIISCTCQIAAASPSIANKSLSHIASAYSQPASAMKTINPQKQARLLKPTSKFDNLIDKVQSIRQGGGIFGKNVKTVISRDIVGLQYSTQW